MSEAQLPGFNRYAGAQAIGGRTDLYVLRPTRRSARLAARRADGYARALYTHGRQAVEAGGTPGRVLADGERLTLDAIERSHAGTRDTVLRLSTRPDVPPEYARERVIDLPLHLLVS